MPPIGPYLGYQLTDDDDAQNIVEFYETKCVFDESIPERDRQPPQLDIDTLDAMYFNDPTTNTVTKQKDKDIKTVVYATAPEGC